MKQYLVPCLLFSSFSFASESLGIDSTIMHSLFTASKEAGQAGIILGVKIFGAVLAFALGVAIVNRAVGR